MLATLLALVVGMTAANRMHAQGIVVTDILPRFSISNSSYLLDTTGRLRAWGSNYAGQLGLGTTSDSLRPSLQAMPVGVTGWVKVAGGRSHTIAIGSDGRLYGWGNNASGETGHNKSQSQYLQPTLIQSPAGVTGFIDIAAGFGTSLAISNTGKLYTWGSNANDVLGIGSKLPNDTSDLVEIAMPTGVTAWRSVAAAATSSFAIGDNGMLYSWGNNLQGTLGVGDLTRKSIPTAVALPAGVTAWKAVYAGDIHAMALTTDGRLFMWGWNGSGQLGYSGTSFDTTRPRMLAFPTGITSWLSVSAGTNHTAVIGNNRQLFVFGGNTQGQLGKGDTINSSTLVRLMLPDGTDRFRFVSAGALHTVAIAANGALYTWGSNGFGQIGDGTNIRRLSPTFITTVALPDTVVATPPAPLDTTLVHPTRLNTGTTVDIRNSWFISSTHGWVVGNGGMLRLTTDGGLTWRVVSTGVTTDLYGIRIIGSTWFIYGANGVLRYSTNGGVTWTNGVIGSTETFYSASFINASYGFVVGSNGSIYFWNGVLFTRQSLSIATTFYGVHVIGGHAYAVGSGGALYRYNGTTWIRITLNVTFDIYDVQFFDDSFGYIVGANGQIMRTINGGVTWVALTTNITINIRSIRIVSRLIAFAVGDGGVLLQTTNGGLTWVRVSSSVTVNLTSIVYVDGVGYYFGSGGTGFSFTSVYISVYSGTTFTRMFVNTSVRLNRTVFVSALVGYIVGDGGMLLRTTDGGITWTIVITGFNFELTSIHAIGSSLYIIGARGYVAVSFDGGLTWQRLDIGTTANLNGSFFFNENYGFIVGAGGSIFMYNGTTWIDQSVDVDITFTAIYGVGRYVYAVGNRGIVFRFDGVRWTQISIGINIDLTDIYFLDEYFGYIIGNGGLIMRTTDGGLTWIRMTTNVSVNLRSIRVLSRTVAIAVGEAGVVLKTTDGGATWIRIDLGASFTFTSVEVIGSTGYIVGTGGIAYSFRIDGVFAAYGLRFTRLSTGTSLRINSGSFASRTTGVIVGERGLVYTTIDGGLSWISSSIGVTIEITDVKVIGGIIFITGLDGIVLRSNDNGATWIRFDLGTTVRFNSMYFVSASLGYVVGANGTVFMWNGTTWVDISIGINVNLFRVHAHGAYVWVVGAGGTMYRYDGRAWLRINSGVNVDLRDIAMYGGSFGYAVGSGGTIIRTLDGGISWTRLSTGITVHVRSIVIYSLEIAWAVCDGGIVLQTLDGGASWQSISIGSDDVLSIDFIDGAGWVFGASGTAYSFTSEHVLAGSTLYRTINRTIQFDGIDGWMDLGSRNEFNFQNCFTLEAWIRPTAFHDTTGIVGNYRRDQTTGSGYALVLDAAGRVGLVVAHHNGITDYAWSSSPVALNAWSHVAGVFDGRSLRVYVDGVEVGQKSIADFAILWITDNSMAVARYFASSRGYFTGQIDEVRLWNTCRTIPELRRGQHLRLGSSETGLISYLRFDDGIGGASVDAIGIGRYGMLFGQYSWMSSDVSIGIGRSWQSTPSTPMRAHYYNGTDVRVDFASESLGGSLVITSLLDERVDVLPPGVLRLAPRVWMIRPGADGFTVNMTFHLGRGAIGVRDAASWDNMRLFYQAVDGDSRWTRIARVIAVDTASGSITFGPIIAGPNGIHPEHGRFVIGTTGDSQLESPAVLAIVTQPIDLRVCVDANTSIHVLADGRNLRYTWRRNGIDIGAASGPTIPFARVTAADAGTYQVSIMDMNGVVIASQSVLLDVVVPPRILGDPTNMSVIEGQRLEISAELEGTQLTYQWQHNGVDIPGATSQSLVFASVDSSAAGDYRLIVRNDCGVAMTSSAHVTVTKRVVSRVDFERDARIAIAVTPNPASGHSVVSIAGIVNASNGIALTLVDARGRQVATLVPAIGADGTLRADIDATSLPSGIYMCRVMRADAVIATTQIVVQR